MGGDVVVVKAGERGGSETRVMGESRAEQKRAE
jgi:hypothetical protein